MNFELLRQLVEAIKHQSHDGSVLEGEDAMRWMAGGGLSFVKVDPATGDRWGLDPEGLDMVDRLAASIERSRSPRSRAATGRQFRTALAKLVMERFAGPRRVDVTKEELEAFRASFDDWWTEQTQTRTHLVPCAVIPAKASEFRIGPVRFLHWNQLTSGGGPLSSEGFPSEQARDAIGGTLRMASASWVACLEVQGAFPDRAEEIADLAVDLAMVAIQLAVPVAHSRHMGRVTRRSPPALRRRVVMTDGHLEVGNANNSPGLALSGPALDQFLCDAGELIGAVGRRTASFADASSQQSDLDSAWSEGAYWLHEGLAEHLDSLAVAKLETAIEVLLRAESTKGSGRRMRQAICAVTGLGETDPISPGSAVTVAALAKRLVGARSKVLHGTSSTLSGDLASERRLLEGLCHTLFATTAINMERYRASDNATDDIEAFLDWLGVEQP